MIPTTALLAAIAGQKPGFNIYTNPYKAKKPWPPDFDKISPKHQFRLERRYKRRAKLKWARPTWTKAMKLTQYGLMASILVYGVLFMEGGKLGTPFDGKQELHREVLELGEVVPYFFIGVQDEDRDVLDFPKYARLVDFPCPNVDADAPLEKLVLAELEVQEVKGLLELVLKSERGGEYERLLGVKTLLELSMMGYGDETKLFFFKHDLYKWGKISYLLEQSVCSCIMPDEERVNDSPITPTDA
ncbi:MAG: hypothetical protein M4579_001491 [Chaenotheca gracillima]|nr:MAG: hypothetical protein M4579_001491 [Chaenotheca gracillima]